MGGGYETAGTSPWAGQFSPESPDMTFSLWVGSWETFWALDFPLPSVCPSEETEVASNWPVRLFRPPRSYPRPSRDSVIDLELFLLSQIWDSWDFSCFQLSQQSCLISCSVNHLGSTLCDPMDYSMPGFPVLHHLLELAQTHVH